MKDPTAATTPVRRPDDHTYHCSACQQRHRVDTAKVLLEKHNMLICWKQFVAGWEPEPNEKKPVDAGETRGERV